MFLARYRNESLTNAVTNSIATPKITMISGANRMVSNGCDDRLASTRPQIAVQTAIIAAAAMQTRKMPPAIAPSAIPPPLPVIVCGKMNASATKMDVPMEAIRPTLCKGLIAGHCLTPGPS